MGDQDTELYLMDQKHIETKPNDCIQIRKHTELYIYMHTQPHIYIHRYICMKGIHYNIPIPHNY